MASTEYVVLRRATDGAWVELETLLASGAPKARRMAAETIGEDVEVVAVPVSSFQSEKFRFENRRALVRGGAGLGSSAAVPAPSGTLVGSNAGSSGGSASA